MHLLRGLSAGSLIPSWKGMEFPWPGSPHWHRRREATTPGSSAVSKIAIIKRNRHSQKENWYFWGEGLWAVIFNVAAHARPKNGDQQYCHTQHCSTKKKGVWGCIYWQLYASKAKEISGEMYLSIFPTNVFVGRRHRRGLEWAIHTQQLQALQRLKSWKIKGPFIQI